MLLDKGEAVWGIGRSAERLQPFVERGAEAVSDEVSNAGFLASVFRGADAVFAMIPPAYSENDFRRCIAI